jgi:replicative DNA helicase
MAMDRETQLATELQALRALCDEAAPREDRQRLLQSLSHHAFIEPEHQVVFESIRALFSRGPLSATQLRAHLNNRGFPDTDVEKYFQSAPADNIEHRPADKITP